MRAVLFLPLVALALISTAGAQERQTPLNCRNCWVTALGEIPACENLSKADMDRFGKLTDAEVAQISDDEDLAPVKTCLCALSGSASDILESCEDSCPPEMAKGLRAEASIVANGVCNVPKPKAQSDENPDNSTSSEGEDGTESENNSASTDPEKSNSEGSDANDKPSTAGASSVQWSGAFLTVVAAMVSAVAF